MSVLAVVVSLLALTVSAATAWLTLLRKGELRMTRPTVIYFGPDGGMQSDRAPMKVYLRTLLYSSAKKGHLIENMFVQLQKGEARQNFNVWSYGEEKLKRGSGLFVPDSGLSLDHHFVLPPDGTQYTFSIGSYKIRVFATEVAVLQPRQLCECSVEITAAMLSQFLRPGYGIYFDWGPDAGCYFGHTRPPPTLSVVLDQITTPSAVKDPPG